MEEQNTQQDNLTAIGQLFLAVFLLGLQEEQSFTLK
jgi:hypothetical protein